MTTIFMHSRARRLNQPDDEVTVRVFCMRNQFATTGTFEVLLCLRAGVQE